MSPLISTTTFNTNSLVKKKNFSLKFVATWCPTCKKELTDSFINASNTDYIYIFGNYGGDTKDKVNEFLKANPHIKSAYFDEENLLRRHFKINKVPTIVTIEDN